MSRAASRRRRAPASGGAAQLVLFLHAHLPDCRRPDQPDSLEETWFFEALAESYLPLVAMLDRLVADAVPVKLTLSVSPTLLAMLGDQALLGRARERWRRTAELARADAAGSEWREHRELAAWHADLFVEAERLLAKRCRGDLVAALRGFARRGVLELATTAATHALLPAHQAQPATVRAQVGVGLDAAARAFGKRPRFFWLPECAYFPGLDAVLAESGVAAFGLETHGVLKAKPASPDVRAPVVCPSGVRALGRDPELSRVVWSAREGYPGDFAYREFHRDRVHEMEESIAQAWPGGAGNRLPSGLKYWRVTGPHERKAWYDPAKAAARVREHAADFCARVAAGGPGIRFVPFDAELFGHWWFEGPLWLEAVFRRLAEAHAKDVDVETATRAAVGWPDPPAAQPAASSWGEAGDFSHWVNHDTAWIVAQLFDAGDRFQRLWARHGRAGKATPRGRALRQAARTLLLAQASDWPFLVKAGTAAETGEERLEALFGRFDRLCAALERGRVPAALLRESERVDRVFPRIELKYWSRV